MHRTWLTRISATADIGIVNVSERVAANDDVRKQALQITQSKRQQML